MFGKAIAVAAILMLGISPAAAKRVALVIGNAAYSNAVQLANPVNDAKAMTEKLGTLGFTVVSGFDQDYMSLRRTIADFARAARGADIALMFYAGHGMQVKGQNYIVPIDAKFEDETALDFETVSMDFIVRQMSSDVRVRMIFLDACRDNPLARSLARRMNPSRSASVGTGLAEIKMEESGGEGSVIAFATSPGDVAQDGGDGKNHSPFTTALLKHIDAPDTAIQSVMTRVTGDVYKSTDERQRPWVNASLIGEVYLNKSAPVPQQVASLQSPTQALPAPAQQMPAGAGMGAGLALSTQEASGNVAWDREKTLFEFAQQGGTVVDYEVYLSAYPDGHFAEIARNYIKRLEAAGKLSAVAPEEAEPAVRTALQAQQPQAQQQVGQQQPALQRQSGGQPAYQQLQPGYQQPQMQQRQMPPAYQQQVYQPQPMQQQAYAPATQPAQQPAMLPGTRNTSLITPGMPGYDPSTPSVADMVRSVPGTDLTEAQLGWDRALRKEVQARLEIAGFELGRPDGAFGPNTRSAVRGWQAANGIVSTGYFTGPQYQVLSSQTETQYRIYEAEQKRAAARTATRSSNGGTKRRNNNKNNNSGTFGAAVMGGIIGGIIGGAIGR